MSVTICGLQFSREGSTGANWFQSARPLSQDEVAQLHAALRLVCPAVRIEREKIAHLPDWAKVEHVAGEVYEVEIGSGNCRKLVQVCRPVRDVSGYVSIYTASVGRWQREVELAAEKIYQNAGNPYYTESLVETPLIEGE